MVHLAEINQAPSPYSMLQHIGRVATLKLVPRNCLRYLQTTLIIGGKGIGLRIYVRYCSSYVAPFFIFFLETLTKQIERTVPTKKKKKKHSLDVFLPLTLYLQLKIQQELFYSLSAPEKKGLYFLEFSSTENRKKKDQVIHALLFNSFVFFYNLKLNYH